MNRIPWQRQLDSLIEKNQREGVVPTLLLHACCAPCSSYCLEYLSEYFRITVFYYNPNITDEGEYKKREAEVIRLIAEQPHRLPVSFIAGAYEPERFFARVRGYEDAPEGGSRCRICYGMRLLAAAEKAKETGADFFATTLTISPLKNADVLNEEGFAAAEKTGCVYLPTDFKKKGGYQRSIELSRIYGLYRQNTCGCVFSNRRDCVTLFNQ